MKINNLKELNKRKTLEYDDSIIFNVLGEEIEYHVFSANLGRVTMDDRNNAYIFDKLKLDKMKLSTECYGYETRNGINKNWPEYKNYDFEAVTRLVKRLYEIIEGRWPEPVFNPITSRFDILDIR